MDDVILTGLLQTLDFVVLEWVGERSFRLLGKLPSWFERLPIRLKPSPEPFRLDDEIPFLENFLVDAERFWRKETERWIKSGPWVEIDWTGHEYALEATAVSIGERKLLLIQTGLSQFLEKREIVQHGRELSLEYRRLQRWEKDLVARQQQLEDLVDARTIELRGVNESLVKEIFSRKETEQILRREEEKFRTLIEECPFGVLWKEQGVPKYINPAFASIFSCRLEDLQTTGWSADLLGLRGAPRAGGDYVQQPVISKMQTRNGAQKSIRWRSVLFGPDNEFLFLEDVTEQRRMEDYLAQAQKMEVVGTLAGGVAHDFNNLLQLIRGYAELLLLRRPRGDSDRVELQEIIEATARGNEITRQLLTLSRRLETQQRPGDLNETVERVHRLLARTLPKNIEVRLGLAPDLGLIAGDPTQLEQVLLNLAFNARDAMPEGGLLSIETCNQLLTPEAASSLVVLEPGEYVVLRVVDTGMGMDEATQNRMFEPFFTTKEPERGAGLGLAMVYGIVKSHRARIFCDSQPGAGTAFRIYFPRSHASASDVPSDRAVIPGGHERILLVEGDDSLRRRAEEILRSFGYRVVSEPYGEMALERFAQEHQCIDLVVLDMAVSGGGVQKCLGGMMAIDPKAKVIITSGLIDARRRTELREAKAFVAKPYSVGVFLQAIRTALDEV